MTADNQRVLQYAIYGLGLVLWYVLWRFFQSVSDLVLILWHLPQPEVPVFGTLTNLYAVLALGLAGFIAEFVRRHETANRFGVEVVSELRKVSWPNQKEVRGTTLVVLGVTLFLGLVLWIFDTIFDGLMGLLFRIGGA